MINYIQTNSNYISTIKILENDDIKDIINKIKLKEMDKCKKYINKISEAYSMSITEILNYLVKYVIQTDIDNEFINICKMIIHNRIISNDILLSLFIVKIKSVI